MTPRRGGDGARCGKLGLVRTPPPRPVARTQLRVLAEGAPSVRAEPSR
jgi:hypothetical protein